MRCRCFALALRDQAAGLSLLVVIRVQNSNLLRIRFRIPAPVLVVAACAVALVGCAPEFDHYGTYYAPSAAAHRSASASTSARPKIAMPDRALLEPQAEPDCGAPPAQQRADKDRPRLARAGAEEQAAGRSDGATAAAVTMPSVPGGAGPDANVDLALRIKLEYERECYRQAEMRVRDRLKLLQASTAQTIRTIKGGEPAAR
jgi:hypothetical protein